MPINGMFLGGGFGEGYVMIFCWGSLLFRGNLYFLKQYVWAYNIVFIFVELWKVGVKKS